MTAHSDGGPDDIVDQIVQGFLEAQLQGHEPDLEQIVAQHPEHEAQIRQQIGNLREVNGLFACLVQPDEGGPGSDASGQELVGRRLGDFEILSLIGRGGMGAVFLAKQVSLDRQVALKVVAGSGLAGNRMLERFRREARALAKVTHPNIVPIYEVGEEGPYSYFAMEYVRGVSLDVVLNAIRKSPPSRRAGAVMQDCLRREQLAASTTGEPAKAGAGAEVDADYIAAISRVVIRVARALDYGHQQGIIHRDVKPSNILIGPEGTPKLVDFGLARVQSQETITEAGEFFGTPNYVSPEHIRSPEAVDGRSDVYSLAATYYECLTLRAPFEAGTVHETLNKILAQEAVSLKRSCPRLSTDLNTVVLHALEKSPPDRYQTAAEFADDIENVLEFRSIRAKRPSLTRRMCHIARGNMARVLLAVSAVAVCSALGVGAFHTFKSRAHAEAEKLYQIGLAKKTSENHREAIQWFDRAMEKDPRYIEAYLAAAECYRSLGDCNQAAVVCRKALQIDNNSWVAFYELGLAMMVAKDWGDAKTPLERAIALRPEFTPAHASLAACCAATKDDDMAISEFRRAAELEPNNPQNGSLWIAVATLLAGSKKHEEAVVAYKQALETNPNLIRAYLGLGLSYAALRQFGEAEAALKKATTIAPDDPATHEQLGWFYAWAGQPLDAIDAYTSAARVSQRANDFDAALTHYGKALQIDPNTFLGLLGTAECHEGLGRYDQAVQFYARALHAIPQDRMLRGLPVRTAEFAPRIDAGMGLCYSKVGRNKEAEAAFLQAIELKPDFQVAYISLAYHYWAKEYRYQDAINCYQKALEIDPRDPTIHQGLGMCYYALYQYENATKSFEVYLGVAPDDESAWAFMASAYSQLGDFAKACGCQERAIKLAGVDYKEAYEHRLSLYRAGQPWREERAPSTLRP